MTAPNQSTLQSAEPGSFWWGYAQSNRDSWCATQGRSFVRQVRGALGLGDGAWNNQLQSALVVAAQALASAEPGAGWNDVVQSLRADLNAQRVSVTSLAFALYLTVYRPAGLLFSPIYVPANTLPPYWDLAPPDDGEAAGGIVCWGAHDALPNLTPGPALEAARRASVAGVRLAPGDVQAPLQGVPGGPSGIPDALAIVLGLSVLGAALGWISRGREASHG